MRYDNNKMLKPRLGEYRTKTKFLWYPRQFEIGQTRWLEFAKVQEVLQYRDGHTTFFRGYYWHEVAFVD